MTSSQKRNWGVALLYVGFIYATLNIVPAPLRFLRSHNVLRLTLFIGYGLLIGGLLWRLFTMAPGSWKRPVLLLGVLSLYPFFARWTGSPEEQIHFAEYGLVGVLFARALQGEDRWTGIILLEALVIGSVIGWIDEKIQGFLPNRHYDVKDIYLNILSVSLGLCVYISFPHKTNPARR